MKKKNYYQSNGKELEENQHNNEAKQPSRSKRGPTVRHEACEYIWIDLFTEGPVTRDCGRVEGEKYDDITHPQPFLHLSGSWRCQGRLQAIK